MVSIIKYLTELRMIKSTKKNEDFPFFFFNFTDQSGHISTPYVVMNYGERKHYDTLAVKHLRRAHSPIPRITATVTLAVSLAVAEF